VGVDSAVVKSGSKLPFPLSAAFQIEREGFRGVESLGPTVDLSLTDRDGSSEVVTERERRGLILGDKKPAFPLLWLPVLDTSNRCDDGGRWELAMREPFPEDGAGAYSAVVGRVPVEFLLLAIRYD
jgi:hypothetical protein